MILKQLIQLHEDFGIDDLFETMIDDDAVKAAVKAHAFGVKNDASPSEIKKLENAVKKATQAYKERSSGTAKEKNADYQAAPKTKSTATRKQKAQARNANSYDKSQYYKSQSKASEEIGGRTKAKADARSAGDAAIAAFMKKKELAERMQIITDDWMDVLSEQTNK